MSNKEIASLEGVVKSNSGVEQMVLFEGSRERSRASIKERPLKGYIDLRGGSMVYFVRREDC